MKSLRAAVSTAIICICLLTCAFAQLAPITSASAGGAKGGGIPQGAIDGSKGYVSGDPCATIAANLTAAVATNPQSVDIYLGNFATIFANGIVPCQSNPFENQVFSGRVYLGPIQIVKSVPWLTPGNNQRVGIYGDGTSDPGIAIASTNSTITDCDVDAPGWNGSACVVGAVTVPAFPSTGHCIAFTYPHGSFGAATYCPTLWLGGMGAAAVTFGGSFGSVIQDFTIQPGKGGGNFGVYSSGVQEQSYCLNVVVRDSNNAGFFFDKVQGNGSGPGHFKMTGCTARTGLDATQAAAPGYPNAANQIGMGYGIWVEGDGIVLWASGGGCTTFPQAYPTTVAAGAVTAAKLTYGGAGCTTAPTCTVSTQHGGSGATCTWGAPSGGVVPSISVSGGTGYSLGDTQTGGAFEIEDATINGKNTQSMQEAVVLDGLFSPSVRSIHTGYDAGYGIHLGYGSGALTGGTFENNDLENTSNGVYRIGVGVDFNQTLIYTGKGGSVNAIQNDNTTGPTGLPCADSQGTTQPTSLYIPCGMPIENSGLLDQNQNPWIQQTAAASAVDGITVANAATANPATVRISATGTDSNINLNLAGKGTGAVTGVNCAQVTGCLTAPISIANVGSAGLSGTAPVTISAAGAIGCATCVTNSAFSSLTSSTNSTAAMVEGTGSSLVTSGQGQIADTNAWIPVASAAIFPAQPTLSFAVGGGALGNLTFFVVVTYVGPATVVPSGEVKITTSGCTSNCTLTVTMPLTCTAGNLPSGVTGCTVWDAPNTAGAELQQAANPNCVNITTATCVITASALGSALVWPTSSGVNPPNLQAVTPTDHIINPWFMQKGDGKYYPVAGVDVSRLNALPEPMGTFTWTDRFFINSSGNAPIISNTLFSVHHAAGDGTTGNGAGIDDRAVGFEYVIPASTSFTDEQFLTQYNEFTFLSNFTCGPTASESCGSAGRFTNTDLRPTNSTNLAMGGQGLTGVSGTFFRNSSGTSAYGSCTVCVSGVRGSGINLISGTGGGQFFAGLVGVVSDQSGVSTNFNSAAIVASLGTRFAGGGLGNIGLWVDSTWTNASDWAIKSDGTAKSVFNGPVYLPTSSLVADAGLVSLQGSLSLLGGSLTTSQLSALAVPQITQGGVAGSTSYTYAVCSVDSNGGQVCSPTQANAAGNATLNGSNFNIVRILSGCSASSGVLLGPVSVNVYRTASSGTPSSTGKIGTIAVPTECITAGANSAVLNDTGLAGDSAPLPTGNNTGGVVASGVIKGTNTVRLTSDSAGITATTPGTTFLTLPALIANTNYSFICEVLYSQATAAVLDGFSVQAATNAATRWDAWGSMDTTNPASTTMTGSKGSALNVTTTTSTPVVSATPGAITTVYQARLSGSIQVGASVPSVQIAAFTGNASDAVTIKAGSFCTTTP